VCDLGPRLWAPKHVDAGDEKQCGDHAAAQCPSTPMGRTILSQRAGLCNLPTCPRSVANDGTQPLPWMMSERAVLGRLRRSLGTICGSDTASRETRALRPEQAHGRRRRGRLLLSQCSSGAGARWALLSLVRLSSEQPIERCGGDLSGTDTVVPWTSCADAAWLGGAVDSYSASAPAISAATARATPQSGCSC
jgi:hypothetical protein